MEKRKQKMEKEKMDEIENKKKNRKKNKIIITFLFCYCFLKMASKGQKGKIVFPSIFFMFLTILIYFKWKIIYIIGK